VISSIKTIDEFLKEKGISKERTTALMRQRAKYIDYLDFLNINDNSGTMKELNENYKYKRYAELSDEEAKFLRDKSFKQYEKLKENEKLLK